MPVPEDLVDIVRIERITCLGRMHRQPTGPAHSLFQDSACEGAILRSFGRHSSKYNAAFVAETNDSECDILGGILFVATTRYEV